MNARTLSLMAFSFLAASWAFAQADNGVPAGATAPANPAPAAASGTPSANRANPRSGPGGVPGAPGSSLPVGVPLKDNVTLSIKGSYLFNAPVDFSITGAGPIFRKASPLPAPDVGEMTLNFNGTIRETNDGYWVDYSFGLSVPVTTAMTGGTRSSGGTNVVQYRNVSFASSVNLKAGQSVVILDNNGQRLTMTLAKADAP